MDVYDSLKPFDRSESLNLFSHWFPKIENCGIEVPKSVVIPVPPELFKSFYLEHYKEDIENIQKFVDEKVMPAVKEAGLFGPLFVKNGTFSNKFDASKGPMCFYYDLAEHIAIVMYESICADAYGESEIVVRERVLYDSRTVPCIYNGLPLRPEFRVFYDFDLKKVLFTVNYWDYDYVYPHLYGLTDKIIFDAMREKMEDTFIGYKDLVEEMVAEAMKNVEGLEGPWSIDIMMTGYHEGDSCNLGEEACNPFDVKLEPRFYLIDMALAERSAYWEKRTEKGYN